jgi:hypothetical protein
MTLLDYKNYKQGNEVLSDLKEANPKKADKGKIQKGIQFGWRHQVKRNFC